MQFEIKYVEGRIYYCVGFLVEIFVGCGDDDLFVDDCFLQLVAGVGESLIEEFAGCLEVICQVDVFGQFVYYCELQVVMCFQCVVREVGFGVLKIGNGAVEGGRSFCTVVRFQVEVGDCKMFFGLVDQLQGGVEVIEDCKEVFWYGFGFFLYMVVYLQMYVESFVIQQSVRCLLDSVVYEVKDVLFGGCVRGGSDKVFCCSFVNVGCCISQGLFCYCGEGLQVEVRVQIGCELDCVLVFFREEVELCEQYVYYILSCGAIVDLVDGLGLFVFCVVVLDDFFVRQYCEELQDEEGIV